LKLKFCVLSVIFAIVILAINQTVNPQSDNFKPYTNKDLDFSIQHPSKWKAVQSDTDGDGQNDQVYFEIRKNPEDKIEFPALDFSITPSSNFRVNIHKIEPELDYNTMILQNKSLGQYVQSWMDVSRKTPKL